MPRFRGQVTTAAPLRMQLSSPGDGTPVRLRELFAAGENSGGGASRPILSRPSTVGTGSSPSTATPLDPRAYTSVCTLLTTFSSLPSTPTVTIAYDLPIRVRWVAADGGWIWVTDSVLFYAQATGFHRWGAEMVWEEL